MRLAELVKRPTGGSRGRTSDLAEMFYKFLLFSLEVGHIMHLSWWSFHFMELRRLEADVQNASRSTKYLESVGCPSKRASVRVTYRHFSALFFLIVNVIVKRFDVLTSRTF